MPCGKRARTTPPHTLLHLGQYSSNHSILFQGERSGGANADSRPDNGTGGKLFELWRYGLSLPLKHRVEEAENMRRKRLMELRKKAATTTKRRQEAREASGGQ